MQRPMSATEARVRLGEVLRRVTEDEDTVIVEHAGRPEAIAISVSEFERLRSAEPVEVDWWALAQQAREHIAGFLGNRPPPSVDEIIHQMREERDAELLAGLS
ncbi:MAG: type II toxin-antitoxin system Phd/YefM family antitoxin [Thermomicrobiales bacterium]